MCFLPSSVTLNSILRGALLELATNHPVDSTHASQVALERSLKDMQAIVDEKSVVERWSDYQLAYDNAHWAYRDAYRDAYTQVQQETQNVASAIRSGTAYKAAPTATRDSVVEKVFGSGGPCDYPALSLGSATSLLSAAAKRSLSSLAQALVALPGYQAQVESDLRALTVAPLCPVRSCGSGALRWRWVVNASRSSPK